MLTEKPNGIRHNGITVYVTKWNSHKKPILAVKVENENCIYKVASFNSIETAKWFVERMEEFFNGLVGEADNEAVHTYGQ